MNLFNYQQKVAMMRILLDIIHADGRIDAREMFYFNQLKEKFKYGAQNEAYKCPLFENVVNDLCFS